MDGWSENDGKMKAMMTLTVYYFILFTVHFLKFLKITIC